MIVDPSALVAIALLEKEWHSLSAKILNSVSVIAAPSLLEAHMVLRSRLGDGSGAVLEDILSSLRIEVIGFDVAHFKAAALAFDRFGKGRHPAALNFGDCMSYALSQSSGQALLFVGNDFRQTDVAIA